MVNPVLAFDARPAQRPPHSYRRLLELFVDAALSVDVSIELWADGPLHPECEALAQYVRPLPQEGAVKENTVMWCLTPDRPVIDFTPRMAMVCDVNPLMPDGRSWFKRWKRGRAFKSKVDYAMQSCRHIVTDSEDARSRLETAFPDIGATLRVVPLYATPSLQPVTGASLTEALAPHDLVPGYLLFVGSFRRHKNWRGLMQAYAGLPDTLKASHPLVFSGAVHRDRANARRLIDSLGLQDHVHILGETSESHMAGLYSGAALFVFPSMMEGFGLPPLEAMQCGTPVVASNRTAIPEVLGDVARYVDPSDAAAMARVMQEVLEDASLRERMAQAGIAHAATFNARRTGQAIIDLLRA